MAEVSHGLKKPQNHVVSESFIIILERTAMRSTKLTYFEESRLIRDFPPMCYALWTKKEHTALFSNGTTFLLVRQGKKISSRQVLFED